MKYADWKYLASICTILGGLLLIGGFIAYTYGETLYLLGRPYVTTYPYRDYAIPLFIFGVVLLVIGVVTFARAEEEKKLESPKPSTEKYVHKLEEKPLTSVFSLKKCPKCGIKFSLEYEVCPQCGVKLEEAS